MKYLLITILLVSSPFTDLDKIAKINELKKEAKAAFTSGDFQTAVTHYNYLLDSMGVKDENITLNLANAYYQLKDSTNAANNYKTLTRSKYSQIKSVAHQQLGVMADRAKKFDEALEHFKNAIRANPANDEARYNYEMLKKMLNEQEKKEENKDKKDQKDQNKENEEKKDQQNQDKQNKDQQKKNQQDKENKEDQQQQDQNKDGEQQDEQQKDPKEKEGEEGKEKENKEQQPKPQEGEESDEKKGQEEPMSSLSEKLKDMKMSEEKAKMILEALKNNEIQYIQQNKRKPTKRKDPNKPDW